jgi:2-isopropylmalate synthase
MKAVDTAIGVENELTYFHIEAITPGEDAQGQVNVRIKHAGQSYSGHGLATDIVEASAKAYISALSRVLQQNPEVVLMGSSTSRWE